MTEILIKWSETVIQDKTPQESLDTKELEAMTQEPLPQDLTATFSRAPQKANDETTEASPPQGISNE